MEVIRRFLEDVVQVVPLESIVYAIAYGKPDEIAIQCAKALMSVHLRPLSQLMTSGSAKAFDRLQSGVSPDMIHDMKTKALAQQFPSQAFGYAIVKDSKQLTVTLTNEEQLPITATSLDWEKLKEQYSEVPSQHVAPDEVRRYVCQLLCELDDQKKAAKKQRDPVNVICGLTIAQLYPVTTDLTQQESALKSPLDILRSGKQSLDSQLKKPRKEQQPRGSQVQTQKRGACNLYKTSSCSRL